MFGGRGRCRHSSAHNNQVPCCIHLCIPNIQHWCHFCLQSKAFDSMCLIGLNTYLCHFQYRCWTKWTRKLYFFFLKNRIIRKPEKSLEIRYDLWSQQTSLWSSVACVITSTSVLMQEDSRWQCTSSRLAGIIEVTNPLPGPHDLIHEARGPRGLQTTLILQRPTKTDPYSSFILPYLLLESKNYEIQGFLKEFQSLAGK